MKLPKASLQLYTVDRQLSTDLDGGLARLAAIGLRTVEAFDFVRRASELRASFDRHGLAASTGHAFLVSDSWQGLDGTVTPVPSLDVTFAAANELGMNLVIDPFVEPSKWLELDDIRRTADKLNAASVVAQRHGLRVGYHNHDHELRAQVGGKPSLQVLADYLDPAVALEVDLFWAAAAGVNLSDLLTYLGDRVVAVHIKDGQLANVVTGQIPQRQVPAGDGEVPLSAALAAAPSIEYAVIEFDAFDGDIFDAVAASYAYLGTKGIK